MLRQVDFAKRPLAQQAFYFVRIKDGFTGLQFGHGISLMVVDILIVADFFPGIIIVQLTILFLKFGQ